MRWTARLSGKALGALAALSLLLAAIVVWVWVASFDGEFHHSSVLRSGQRYTLKSKWGQFVLFGPPQRVEDLSGGELAKQMSNADFEWQAVRPGFVEGIGKPDSPTWRMYRQYREWLAGNPQAAPLRTWLASMEDESRFLPSHFMLLNAAEEKRKEYFHLTYSWREGAFRTEPTLPPPEASRDTPEMRIDPVLYIKADASGNAPDFSLREKLRQEWHDVLDTPRWAVFHGWVVLGLMVLPLAWVARPRWQERTTARWGFNAMALVSVIICVSSAAMWVRSYWVDEQWIFAEHPSTARGKWNYPMKHQSWMGSSNGMFLSRGSDVPEAQWVGVKAIAWGYQKQITPGPTLPANISIKVSGERQMKVPGLRFHALPLQVITIALPARLVSAPGAPPGVGIPYPATTSTTLIGFHSLAVSWWLLVLISAVLPAIWAWGAGVRWRRILKSRRLAAKICLKCGYDMRATPERCPECGNAVHTLSAITETS